MSVSTDEAKVVHVAPLDDLPVQLILLAGKQFVFMCIRDGKHYDLPNFEGKTYNKHTLEQPIQDFLQLTLGLTYDKPLHDVNCAVQYKTNIMRVVMVNVQLDIAQHPFGIPNCAFVSLQDVLSGNEHFTRESVAILSTVVDTKWFYEPLQVTKVGFVPLLPYRIILQSKESKNVFLELAQINNEAYSRLPGNPEDCTEQQAHQHALDLAQAINGNARCDIRRHVMDRTRYIVVSVPCHGGRPVSPLGGTEYRYSLPRQHKVECGSFFTLEAIRKSTGHVAINTQKVIAMLLLEKLINKL